jgi:hypothetical protein
VKRHISRCDVAPMPRLTHKRIDFSVGQRVLFRYPTRKPIQWLSGAISPKSRQSRLYYEVKLDNGESRWGALDHIRKATL